MISQVQYITNNIINNNMVSQIQSGFCVRDQNNNIFVYQEVVVCGTGGHLVAQGGDLRGRKVGEQRDEVLYIDVEDFNSDQSFSPLLPR